MRSTLEIILAVKESRQVEPEELRLALLAMSSIEHFTSKALNDLIETIEERPKVTSLMVRFAKETRERMFQSLKKDPAEWLGPSGIPGTPEHDEAVRLARAIGKAAGVL